MAMNTRNTFISMIHANMLPNIVANPEGDVQAVLTRAIIPTEDIKTTLRNRKPQIWPAT